MLPARLLVLSWNENRREQNRCTPAASTGNALAADNTLLGVWRSRLLAEYWLLVFVQAKVAVESLLAGGLLPCCLLPAWLLCIAILQYCKDDCCPCVVVAGGGHGLLHHLSYSQNMYYVRMYVWQ